MCKKKDEQGRNSIDKYDKYFMHIDMNKVESHQVVKRCHEQKSNASLDKSSIKSDRNR